MRHLLGGVLGELGGHGLRVDAFGREEMPLVPEYADELRGKGLIEDFQDRLAVALIAGCYGSLAHVPPGPVAKRLDGGQKRFFRSWYLLGRLIICDGIRAGEDAAVGRNGLLRGVVDRQQEVEPCALARRVLRPDLPVMAGYDLLTDGQSQARSFVTVSVGRLLQLHEFSEEFREALRSYAGAVVDDADGDPVGFRLGKP